jgi:hypothetical protein
VKDSPAPDVPVREIAGEDVEPIQKPGSEISSPNRRSFLGKLGGAAGAAVAVGTMTTLQPLLGGKGSQAEASVIPYGSGGRAASSFAYRGNTARNEFVNPGVPPDNGDAARFSDHSGTWTKTLAHDSLGIVNQSSYASFIKALTTGNFSDFQDIIVGNPTGTNGNHTLNGPQGALAFDLEGLDSHATVIPPAPSITSAQSADEEVEHYWAALLRDTPFLDYGSSALAAQAASELNNLSYIKSGANTEFPYPVTPQNLFRGQIVPGDGSVQGPYISQLLLQPTFWGALPCVQQYRTFLPGQNFMTTAAEYQNVENGFPPTGSLAYDPTHRYFCAGRDLAAYTNVDVLYEAYLMAFLVLSGIGAPPNPGNPYIGSTTENGFETFGGPDMAASIPEMATRALKASWYHKWIVNLRPRPEDMGALVHARLANVSPLPQAAKYLHPDVLNSQAVQQCFSQFGSYLLPQAFPTGAPTHPCYPTGHGTVGGACITALKFFLDGSQLIRPLLQAAGSDVMQASADGTQLIPYTGSDINSLTINGELSKLAFNISFGHGIHAGIHFRSSTNWSILLGEQVALSVLQDRARSYNEPFTVSITKFDGTTATITNQR